MVLPTLRKIWHPELFQGSKYRRKYFEGWYFKLVDAAEETILAVVPGIALGVSHEDSHAFVQVFNGKTGDYTYFTFSVNDFLPASRRFEVRIAENYFSASELRLELQQPSRRIRGELQFKNVIPYPKRLLSPGFMGWASFVPFMQCKHGIVSMNHTLEGALEIDGERITFDGGKGYIEKDWGHSFPSAYIWMHSNHFTHEAVSFTLVLARLSWLGLRITGFGAALWYNDRVYTLATYMGARITRLEYNANQVRLTIEDKRFELVIEAIQGSAWPLKSPVRGSMAGTVTESLTSTLHLTAYEKTKGGKQLLLEDTGRNAGLEIHDPTHDLARALAR
jgi:tocopherol cyclase